MCRTRNVRLALLLLVFSLLTACKTSQEAANAATGLTNTTQRLAEYYTDLSHQVTDLTSLSEMYSEFNFQKRLDDDTQTEMNTLQQELAQRIKLAHQLGKLEEAYSSLATSKAASDVSTAASELASQCQALTPMTGGSAIPDIVGQAASSWWNT